MSRTSVRRTKIVATLGPAWEEPAAMAALIDAGVNVVRINASHGTPEIRARWVERLRSVMASRNDAVAILLDLQGPRIRVGTLAEPLRLVAGRSVVFAPEGEAAVGEIPTTYEGLAGDVSPGARILLDDGLMSLEVRGVDGHRVEAVVQYGGELKSHKGMNLPGIEVSAPALTEKDLEDVAQAVAVGVDYVALSFVRRPEDIEQLRALVPRSTKLIAKIEKDTALRNLCGILDVSDAIMVARGDLGVELPFEEVPLMQKQIIREAGLHGKPVITATQMLESMVHAPRPTRAEASDVANAILDGTDAVMLSAETAAGQYPELAVRAMTRIITEMERHPVPRPARIIGGRRQSDVAVSTEDAIAAATAAAAASLEAPVVMVITKSGFTARIVASHRPPVPIIALTDSERTYRQLALVWGVQPLLLPPAGTYEEMFDHGRDVVQQLGLVKKGDRVLVTAGVPFDVPRTTNLLRVEVV
jgi:pyruvate kinase